MLPTRDTGARALVSNRLPFGQADHAGREDARRLDRQHPLDAEKPRTHRSGSDRRADLELSRQELPSAQDRSLAPAAFARAPDAEVGRQFWR